MALAGLAVMGAIVGVGIWLQHRMTGGRTWSPLWTAFSLTAGALLFVVAGVAGYRLQGGVPFSRAASWTGSMIRHATRGAFRWLTAVPDAGYHVDSLGGRCS